jgi:hypothetical protein
MMDGNVEKPGESVVLRKLTHTEARAEQRLYWSRKTMAERLTAMWELNRRMALWRGVGLDERETAWTIRRVSHRATYDLDDFIRPTISEDESEAGFR